MTEAGRSSVQNRMVEGMTRNSLESARARLSSRVRVRLSAAELTSLLEREGASDESGIDSKGLVLHPDNGKP